MSMGQQSRSISLTLRPGRLLLWLSPLVSSANICMPIDASWLIGGIRTLIKGIHPFLRQLAAPDMSEEERVAIASGQDCSGPCLAYDAIDCMLFCTRH